MEICKIEIDGMEQNMWMDAETLMEYVLSRREE